jgi:hypothetical protein
MSKIRIIGCMLAALVLNLALAQAAGADATCADGKVCFWKQQNYNGDKETAEAADAEQNLTLGEYDRSMKNRFANRKVIIRSPFAGVLDCVNPGHERDDLPAAADIFRIGPQGSSC